MNTYILYINIGNNNVLLTIVNINGKIINWCSSGKCVGSGSKKSTNYSAQLAAKTIKNYLESINCKSLDIRLKGYSNNRDIIIRELYSNKYIILSINDITPLIFNGCRSKKIRRT